MVNFEVIVTRVYQNTQNWSVDWTIHVSPFSQILCCDERFFPKSEEVWLQYSSLSGMCTECNNGICHIYSNGRYVENSTVFISTSGQTIYFTLDYCKTRQSRFCTTSGISEPTQCLLISLVGLFKLQSF